MEKWKSDKQSVEKNGLLVLGFTVVLMLAGVFMTPIGILTGIDPFRHIFQTLFPTSFDNPYTKYPLKFVGYVLTHWCILEASREYSTFLVPTMTIANIYLRCLQFIEKRVLSEYTFLMYQQLHCLNQRIIQICRIVAGLFMGCGLVVLLVGGNWIAISGWDYFSAEVYFLMIGLLIIMYFILYQTLPLMVSCDETSKELIQKWKLQIYTFKEKKRYLLRVVKSQRLVSFYYGMTKMEKETKINFYSTILDRTIDLLLIT